MSSWTFPITGNRVLSISVHKLTTWQDLGINFQAFHLRNQYKHKTEHLLLSFYRVFDTRKQLPFDPDPYCFWLEFTENLCEGCNIKCQLHTKYSICNHVKGCLHQSLPSVSCYVALRNLFWSFFTASCLVHIQFTWGHLGISFWALGDHTAAGPWATQVLNSWARAALELAEALWSLVPWLLLYQWANKTQRSHVFYLHEWQRIKLNLL